LFKIFHAHGVHASSVIEIQPVVAEVVSQAANWPGVTAKYSPIEPLPPLIQAPAPVDTETAEVSPVTSHTGCEAETLIWYVWLENLLVTVLDVASAVAWYTMGRELGCLPK
jgi:hypothetical protein